MDHIERNRCRRIKAADLEKRRALKEMFMAQMASQAAERQGPLSVLSDCGDSGEDGGGVALNVSSLLDNLEDDRVVDYPALDPASPAVDPASPAVDPASPAVDPASPAARSNTVSEATSPHTSDWPALALSKSGAVHTDVGTLNADDSQTAPDTGTKEEPTSAWGGSSSAALFPNAPKTPATLDWTKSIMETPAGPRARDDPKIVLESTMDPNSRRFNPYQFRNAIGMFKCPYPKCG